jgi:hypothetical protein
VVGNPNGGQGGDGTIARNVTNQYVAGWDWIQPVHDRNTGIWDKVFIEKVRGANIEDVQVVTHVPGKRNPSDRIQPPATIDVSADVINPGTAEVSGQIQYTIEGRTITQLVSLQPHEHRKIKLSACEIKSPKLWWCNGLGQQYLYGLTVRFITKTDLVGDEEHLKVGVREITTGWNVQTQSREIYVNGQRIFVKGANWILSDGMLRFSVARYDAEVRYHRDMNLNMIRVWGGGITERPEFYDACDKYGLLVFQDFWITGDCNGRWYDTYKKDDTDTRRAYPDNHTLWLAAAADQIKMLRNHPSLAIWCGGNELRPPVDILHLLRDSLLPELDEQRYFFEYSNHDSMSLHAHDGPYTIQKDGYFWQHRSYAFNSEVGSVGIGDAVSLRRFLPDSCMVPPRYDEMTKKWVAHPMWQYHKYSSYDSAIEAYGHPDNAREFADMAQLVNYNQYRALMEGIRSHMWSWYTGVLVWKTQNPWTAMVGQMYDRYLDPNACLYGLQAGAKPLHVMYDPIRKKILVANDTREELRVSLTYGTILSSVGTGEDNATVSSSDSLFKIPADSCIAIADFEPKDYSTGAFLSLSVADNAHSYSDDNLYWLPDGAGTYRWLQRIAPQAIFMAATARYCGSGCIEISLSYNGSGIAFFNHITLLDKKTKERILPVFCSDNYVSVYPAQPHKKVKISYALPEGTEPIICIEGWNTGKRYMEIQK